MTRAYVDRRVSDLSAATEAARFAARRWGLPDPVVLRHGMNAIFRCDDVVLRVATPTAPAAVSIELAETLAGAGIRVPQPARDHSVESGGFAVTAWRYVVAVGPEIDWVEVGSMVRRVHGLTASQLPAGLPRPSPAEFPWWNLDALLQDVQSDLDGAAFTGLSAAVERHSGWTGFVVDDTVVSHGDVHPGNIIMSDDGPVLLDWDLLCLAPRGWDHSALMTWSARWGGDAGLYERFADGYGWSARGDPHAEAFAELRLVAATLMRWRVARSDPQALPEAERRLAYWRGDRGAPAWQAQ